MNVNKILCIFIILLTGFIVIGSTFAVDGDSAVDGSDIILNEPITVDINATIDDGVYGENLTGHVDTQGHNGTVIFQLVSGSSTPIMINVLEDGNFIIPNSDKYKPGVYSKAHILFISDDESITGGSNLTITVNKAPATVEIIYENYTYSSDLPYGLFKLSKYAEEDSVIIDYYYDMWSFYTSTIAFNGEANFTYPFALKPGTHYLIIDWVQSQYYDYTYEPVEFTSYKGIPIFTVVINPEDPGNNKFTWGDDVTFYFSDLEQDLSGDFSYSIDNETWFTLSGNEGIFSFGSDLDEGNYILFVKYSGDDFYNESIVENPFIIEKRDVIISIDDIVAKAGSKTKVTVKVVDDRGIPVEEGTIIIEINGKTYTADVKDGIAIVEIDVPSGKFTAKAYFKGGITNYADGETTFNVSSTSNPKEDSTNSVAQNLLENTGNPLVVLLIALATIGIGSLKRKL